MYHIRREVEFSAAHHLPTLPPEHKCHRVHGHNYKVVVTARATWLDDNGFVIDFGEIAKLLRDQYDHRDLNDFFDNPTAEILARDFFDQLTKAFTASERGVRIDAVTVYETDGCWAQYEEWTGQ